MKTLAEAAAEVLNRSIGMAPSDPMIQGYGAMELGGEDNQGNVNSPATVGASIIKPVAQPQAVANPLDVEVQSMEDDEEDEDEEHMKEEKDAAINAVIDHHMASLKEDIDALFSSDSTLSEEFKSKATTIFEAAVKSRVKSIVESIMDSTVQTIHEEVEASASNMKSDLVEQLDSYTSYVAEQWLEQNRIEVTSGIRAELAEEFISGLKTLFEEHYIDIPEEKVDVVAEMAERVSELEGRLNESINANVELSKTLNEAKKVEIVNAACRGLTDTQAVKVRALAEGVEFTTEGDYKDKVATIRESYFPSKAKIGNSVTITEDVSTDDIPMPEVKKSSQVKTAMDMYVNTIKRTLPTI